MIAEAMDQNIVALQAADGVFNQDSDGTQSLIFGLLLIGQRCVGIFLAFARLLMRDLDDIAYVIGENALVA